MKFIKFLLRSIISMLAVFFILFVLLIYNDNKENIQLAQIEDNIEEIEKVEQVSVSKKEKKPAMQEGVMERTEPQETHTIASSNKFYGSNLEEYSKIIYTSLEEQKYKLKKDNEIINLPSSFGRAVDNGEDIQAIFTAAVNAFEFDNPELFYIDLPNLILYYERTTFGKYNIYLKNSNGQNSLLPQFKNENDVNNAENEINEVVNQIKETLDSLDSDYDKILYIHDWLVENVKYDETISRPNKDTIYGVFVEKEAVCGGYSKAFKYLLDMENIDTIIIQGVGSTQDQTENHAWNYVKMDDEWYGVDCTWDDPVLIGNVTSNNQKKFYTYFLKGKEVFEKDHTPFVYFYGTNFLINYPELSYNDY